MKFKQCQECKNLTTLYFNTQSGSMHCPFRKSCDSINNFKRKQNEQSNLSEVQ